MMLLIQKDINENGPIEFHDLELIRLEELQAIRRIWVFDKHEFDDSVPAIYEEIMGIPFKDDEWLPHESFGKSEWELLKKVCEEEFPDEELAFEMMYSLIDVESSANGMNNRNNINKELNKVLSSTYYRDEVDALDYYEKKMSRKKNLGGKYNEKFFDGESELSDNGSLEEDEV